ncbi:pyridoxal phosphate-dependent aminotransferase [Dermabacteraceae bacterium TAE3-ERU27]|nr:pyridoxal phosphate-dependent aminotransferase [Dermabacteraceae bacterium TAE3-ERU27]
MIFEQSSKLRNVCYEIRGPVPAEAARMEAAGEKILKLNIGNPAPFGFQAPAEIVAEMVRRLPGAEGYSDSRGILEAREAVAQRARENGITDAHPDDVYLGNGVSELIQLVMQALVDTGDEVLVPAPDYPLWTACVSLAGGRAVHYRCDEENHWWPDLADIEAKISERTKALVIINPNNPTGAVYPTHVLEGMIGLARKHGLLLLSDEIYDQILYDGAVHTPTATLAPDLFCITFNGLSKAYRLAGFRSGWMLLSGPREHAENFIEGLNILANMRLCANVPAQHAVAAALSSSDLDSLLLPGGRLLEQRNLAHRMLNEINGISCEQAAGALYLFPRIDREKFRIDSDEQFALDLLREKKILVVHGTGFNWPEPDHFRVVTLPDTDTLGQALTRMGEFLDSVRR